MLQAVWVSICLALCVGCLVHAQRSHKKPLLRYGTISVGSKAPDFTLYDEQGVAHSLKDMRGHKMAIYFYPYDNTPGCTAQACSIRDGFHDLQKAGIIVWGISSNPPASHANFKDKYHLPFTLLSDGTKEVAALYSVKGWFLVDRVTFLIDEQGIVVGILNNVDVKAHARQIIDAFARHAQK